MIDDERGRMITLYCAAPGCTNRLHFPNDLPRISRVYRARGMGWAAWQEDYTHLLCPRHKSDTPLRRSA